MTDISLIGVPTDIGASRIGCRLGPQALRVAGLIEVWSCSAMTRMAMVRLPLLQS